MRIIEIKNITRKDVPLYYRMHYSGIAVLELVNRNIDCCIDFSVETKPTGVKEISITKVDVVDYPLIPLKKELKQFIGALDSGGGLPV
ncbi:MAG: hypothetical protein LBL43_00150 [Treponema sp.]|jgi:hypothetical protein|nr:hypothetical protein [Treponema sp.]